METKNTSSGNEDYAFQEFTFNKNFVKIRYSSHEDIIIEYFNTFKLDKFYQIILNNYELGIQFDKISTFDIYKNMASSLSSNFVEIKENEDEKEIDMKLIISNKDYIFTLNEKEKYSYIMQIINNIKGKEISNLKIENNNLKQICNELKNKYKVKDNDIMDLELKNKNQIKENENIELKNKYKVKENENVELKKKKLMN